MHITQIRAFLTALISMLMVLSCAAAEGPEIHKREDIRKAYSLLNIETDVSPYAVKPSVSGEYAAGSLTEEALDDTLAYVNFIRYVAYLDSDVVLDEVYIMRAQHGAVLLAANDKIAHDSPRAPGMPDGFYGTAYTGTMSSNLAAINWMDGDILIVSAEYFVRDDGEANLSVLGHRRWLLNPYMGKTGFGLANSESGMSYTVMYVHDDTNDPGYWENVKWPSEGAFPADLTSYDIPWSVTLNPEVYSSDFSDVTVSMYEIGKGRAEIKYFNVSTESYGAGPAIIFMPDLEKMGIYDYQQNQVWHVRIEGLRYADGSPASIEYAVEMMSLYPIDPSAVEVEPRALDMDKGDVCLLSAAVIPEWADDISVTWSSTDESVAVVDENGYVTAVGEGECGIIASAVNGRSDECRITVK